MPDLSCNDTSSCTVAPQGYAFSGGIIYVCLINSINGCSGCGFSNLSLCTSTSVGFYLENGLAVACPKSCSNCASA
jgi:hypothetical protein